MLRSRWRGCMATTESVPEKEHVKNDWLKSLMESSQDALGDLIKSKASVCRCVACRCRMNGGMSRKMLSAMISRERSDGKSKFGPLLVRCDIACGLR